MQTRNYQQPSQQQGFVLVLALLLMLFIGVIVISSAQRTGTETRVAQSEVPIASLQAAAEAGVFYFRERVRDSLQDETFGEGESPCAFIQKTKNAENDLASFLHLGGKGASKENAQPFGVEEGVTIYWYLDSTKMEEEYCINDEITIYSVAFAGSHNNQIAKITLTATIEFKPDGSGSGNSYKSSASDKLLDDIFSSFEGGLMLDSPISCQVRGNNQSAPINGVSCTNFQSVEQMVDLTGFNESFLKSVQAVDEVSESDVIAHIQNRINSGEKYIELYVPNGGSFSDIDAFDKKVNITIFSDGDITFDKNVKGVRLIQLGGSVNLTGSGSNSFEGDIFAPFSSVHLDNGSRHTKANIVSNSLEMPAGSALDFPSGLLTSQPPNDNNNDGGSYKPTTRIIFDY